MLRFLPILPYLLMRSMTFQVEKLTILMLSELSQEQEFTVLNCLKTQLTCGFSILLHYSFAYFLAFKLVLVLVL